MRFLTDAIQLLYNFIKSWHVHCRIGILIDFGHTFYRWMQFLNQSTYIRHCSESCIKSRTVLACQQCWILPCHMHKITQCCTDTSFILLPQENLFPLEVTWTYLTGNRPFCAGKSFIIQCLAVNELKGLCSIFLSWILNSDLCCLVSPFHQIKQSSFHL